MQKVQLQGFNVIGIAVRTHNGHGQASKDIPALWQKFMTEGILEKIPNKVNNHIYSIYTNYNTNHEGPYDTILGCEVNSIDNIPEGMVAQTIDTSDYMKKTVEGDISAGMIIYEAWMDIWKSDINRSYKADFEIYDNRSANQKEAVVDIYVSVK